MTKLWIKLLCALLCTGGLLCACAAPQQEAPALRVTFFQAGSADAILVQTEGKALLIDTGLHKNEDALVTRLRQMGVTRLDALIITHFDKDHVGGAAAVLSSFPVDAVYEPAYYKESGRMSEYRLALARCGLTPQALTENTEFSLGAAHCALDVANQSFYGEDEENDFSLVLRLTFGDTRFLFTGDAEAPRIAELLEEGDLAADVLKVPHHGREHSNNLAFFQAVSPAYAVITSGGDEPESALTVRQLEQVGAQVLLTRQGEITLVSDGTTVSPAS